MPLPFMLKNKTEEGEVLEVDKGKSRIMSQNSKQVFSPSQAEPQDTEIAKAFQPKKPLAFWAGRACSLLISNFPSANNPKRVVLKSCITHED